MTRKIWITQRKRYQHVGIFALGDAKVPNANGFASQWNIGFRDWSLITGRGGGLQNGRGGGHVKFYPYEKGGRKKFCHAEGGAQKVLG